MKKLILILTLIISLLLVLSFSSCIYAREKTAVFNEFSCENSYDDTNILLGESSMNNCNKTADKLKAHPLDLTGRWKRTNVEMAFQADITITNQTATSFDFDFEGWRSADQGNLNGTAIITERSSESYKAEFSIEKNEITDSALIIFELTGDTLKISLTENSDYFALGFGAGVAIDGEYTKGKPYFINAGIVNEILKEEKTKSKFEALMGNSDYEQMIAVLEYGLRDESSTLSYSGFLSGTGEGVDILIKGDKVYCLGYGLYTGGYVFYTNDSNYKEKMPDGFKRMFDDIAIKFVYKNV